MVRFLRDGVPVAAVLGERGDHFTYGEGTTAEGFDTAFLAVDLADTDISAEQMKARQKALQQRGVRPGSDMALVRAAVGLPETDSRSESGAYELSSASDGGGFFATRTAVIDNSKVHAQGAIRRYMVNESDPNYDYVTDESLLSAYAKDNDSLHEATTRHQYASFVRLVNWGPQSDRPGSSTCPTSSVGFTYFGVSYTQTYPACLDFIHPEPGIDYMRVSYVSDAGASAGKTRSAAAENMAKKPVGTDTALSYMISAKTCGIITCTTYGPAYGS